MAAIKVETNVDETTAGAIPELRPLLGQDVVLVAMPSRRNESSGEARTRISFEEFLHEHRLRRPSDVPPVSLEDLERAIGRGAIGGDV